MIDVTSGGRRRHTGHPSTNLTILARAVIDAYGAPARRPRRGPLSNRSWRIDLNPDNWPDDVGVAEDDRVQGIREAR
jgi:hypothetical protein